MPLAACSGPWTRDLAQAGVFARSAWSSAKSALVTVSTGYCLFLNFSYLKLFPFITSIEILSLIFS